MGTFQAFTSGLGKGGEDLATGVLQAQQTAWARQQDTIRNNLEQQRIDITRAGQAQAYNLAQQQHELYRQSLLDQGWRDNGVVLAGNDPSSGQPKYVRNFVNMRDGSTRQVPVNGLPLDSPQASLNYLAQLKGLKDDKGKPVFSDIEAAQIAFKMPMLYRQGPGEIYKSFQGIGSDKFPDNPAQASKFGQRLWDEYVGKAGYWHYGPGSSLSGHDTTGFTANEKREFDAYNIGLNNMSTNIMKLASAEMQATLDPTQQAAISARYMTMLQQLEQQREGKYNEIQSRRGKPVGQVGQTNLVFSKSKWQAAHPGQDISQDMAAAQRAGAIVVP